MANSTPIPVVSHSDEEEQIVTPFKVESTTAINYMKLINKFGCDPIDGELLKRFERVTKTKADTWLRRGIFFSHKDLSKVLDEKEAGRTVYLYTGRGPSSEAMHLGHMIPFRFTKFLQDALEAILVIQMSDDEKFVFKGKADGKSFEYYNRLTYENARDIIACGFDPERTYIWSNAKAMDGSMYANVTKIDGSTTGNKIRGIYGLTLDSPVGALAWPSKQCAPAFSNSFPSILHPKGPYSEPFVDGSRTFMGKHMMCLVPMAIDQDPYFRMARDFGAEYAKHGYLKPATIHTKFLVGLGGPHGKMSSTGTNVANTTLYMTDNIEQIRKKIMKHAFSGGKETKEDHQKYGGTLEDDVSYQYLCYFMHDDEELKRIAHDYRSGKLLSGQIKKLMAELVCNLISEHQKRREDVTDDVLRHFFNRNRKFNLTQSEREPVELETDEVYATYGINFDLTFGATAPVVEDSKSASSTV